MKKMISFFTDSIKPVHIIITAALTILMLAVMDIYSLPMIAKAAGGIPAFDLQTFGYSYETATQFLNNLSQSGRNLFLHFQLPLDFAFAFVYTFLFLTLFIRLHPVGSKLCFIPLILFVLDIIENSLSVVLLKADNISTGLVKLASTVTFSKNLFTWLCSLIIIVFLILWFKNRKKNQKA